MIELALRVTVILLVAWLVARALRRATAATRHLVWHSAIVAVLAAPIVGPFAPRFEVAPLIVGKSSHPSDATAAASTDADAPRSASIEPAVISSSHPVRFVAPFDVASTLGAYAWPMGSAILLLWFSAGWLVTAFAARRARPAPTLWQVESNALRLRLRIPREVRLRIVSNATSPVVTGLWRPTILLPQAAHGWDADRRRNVFLHELAHIARGDLRVQAMAQAACALYWFNPLVWVTFARLRSECERACDDAVLRSGTLPSAYAAHLLDIARELSPVLRPSHALAMARSSQLEGRLLAVLATGQSRVPARGSRWAVSAVIVVTMALALGASASRHEAPATAVDSRSVVARRTLEPFYGLNPIERQAAAQAVARASERLETARDPQDREDAALELIASEHGVGAAPFEAALSDPDQDVREKAALGLGLISSPNAIPGLLKALEDPDAQVREKAAIGLALRRDARVASALIVAMNDPDAQVREKAAISLGTSGDRRAMSVLERALEDRDSQVREKAAAGLILLRSGPHDAAAADGVRDGLRGVVGSLIGLVSRD